MVLSVKRGTEWKFKLEDVVRDLWKSEGEKLTTEGEFSCALLENTKIPDKGTAA